MRRELGGTRLGAGPVCEFDRSGSVGSPVRVIPRTDESFSQTWFSDVDKSQLLPRFIRVPRGCDRLVLELPGGYPIDWRVLDERIHALFLQFLDSNEAGSLLCQSGMPASLRL